MYNWVFLPCPNCLQSTTLHLVVTTVRRRWNLEEPTTAVLSAMNILSIFPSKQSNFLWSYREGTGLKTVCRWVCVWERQTVKIKKQKAWLFFFNISLEMFYYVAPLKQRMLHSNPDDYMVNPWTRVCTSPLICGFVSVNTCTAFHLQLGIHRCGGPAVYFDLCHFIQGLEHPWILHRGPGTNPPRMPGTTKFLDSQTLYRFNYVVFSISNPHFV